MLKYPYQRILLTNQLSIYSQIIWKFWSPGSLRVRKRWKRRR